MRTAIYVRCSPLLRQELAAQARRAGYGRRQFGVWLVKEMCKIVGMTFPDAVTVAKLAELDPRQLKLPTPPPRPTGGERRSRLRKGAKSKKRAAPRKRGRHV